MTDTLLNQTCIEYLKSVVRDLPTCGRVVAGGVYNGGDIKAMGEVRDDLHFLCIDSFEGLAEPTEEDDCKGVAKAGECACDSVQAFIGNVTNLDVTALKIWITDDLLSNIYITEKIDLLWLDLDHYEPTRAMLKKFLPMCARGAIVLTHDYGFRRTPGIKTACDEFGKWELKCESIAQLIHE